MRSLLLALFVTLPAFAWVPDASVNLKDVQYIPKAGVIFGETTLSQEKYEYIQDNRTNSDEVESKNTDRQISQRIGFGFTDALSASVTLAHQFSGVNDSETNGGNDPEVDTEGPINPVLAANLRILNQSTDSVNLDLVFAFAPDLFDAETDSNKNENTAAQGGNVLVLGARAGKKFKELQMSGEAYLNIFGESESEDKANNNKTKTDAIAQTVVRYNVQTDILPIADYRLSFASIVTAPYESKEAGTKSEYDMSNRWELGQKLLFSVVEDQFLVTFNWVMHYTWPYEVKVGGTKFEIQDLSGHDLELAAVYQF